jgi:hypothetical protein
MFVQVIEGKVKDRDLLMRQMQRWVDEIKPGVRGFLGSTGGVTDDGRSVWLARFESAAAASDNSGRELQDSWWADTMKAYDGAPVFHDCPEADEMFGGGSNDATFVQVISGRTKDQAAARRMFTENEDALRQERPDILGGLVAWHGDGSFTQAVYFESEEAAHRGEQSASTSELMAAYRDLFEGPPTFYDFRDPRMD